MIKITFPDGLSREYDKGITVGDIAQSISPGLRKKSVCGLVNGQLYDINRPIDVDSEVKIITQQDQEAFQVLNHSGAHILAQAVKRLFPEAKFGVGPAIEEGFYYDIDATIGEDDLVRIEKEMKKIASEALEIVYEVISREAALALFRTDVYKLELISAIPEGEAISIYRQGEFVDLCGGIHIGNTKNLKYFKLLNLAGAYWRGKSENPMLTRVYGTAHFTEQALNDHLTMLQDRKERDHKKLGKELELFTFHPLVGQGLPIYLPNGAKIRQQIEKYVIDIEEEFGYQHVYTPVIGSVDLYKTSGHWSHYKEDMFVPMEMDNEELVLRPMSCPHHMMIFKSKLRSYRDLPIMLAEQVIQHRYEASGALTGLERVRAMTLTDSHMFVRMDQIEMVFKNTLELIHRVFEDFDVEVHYYRLSLRDPLDKGKYFDNDKMWDEAEDMLRNVLIANHVDYQEEKGEAAFYGPKLDIQIKTALGHDITLSTIQLDFLLPERFDLEYVDETGGKTRPVVIHRGLIGTYERFLAMLIENYKGAFPLWLAPKHVDVLPVNLAHHSDYAELVARLLRKNKIRFDVDNRNEKLGYKIRESQIKKVPYSIVLGDKEMESNSVTYRRYGDQASVTISLEEFVDLLKYEIEHKIKYKH